MHLEEGDKDTASKALHGKNVKNRMKDLLTYFELTEGGVQCKQVFGPSKNSHEVCMISSKKVNSRSFVAETRAAQNQIMRQSHWETCQVLSEKECRDGNGICYIVKLCDGSNKSVVNVTGVPQMVRPRPQVPRIEVLQKEECIYVWNDLAPIVAAAAIAVDRRRCMIYHTLPIGKDSFEKGSRRMFAKQVRSKFRAFGVTESDARRTLDVLFDRSGRAQEVCEFYSTHDRFHLVFEVALQEFDSTMNEKLTALVEEAEKQGLNHTEACASVP